MNRRTFIRSALSASVAAALPGRAAHQQTFDEFVADCLAAIASDARLAVGGTHSPSAEVYSLAAWAERFAAPLSSAVVPAYERSTFVLCATRSAAETLAEQLTPADAHKRGGKWGKPEFAPNLPPPRTAEYAESPQVPAIPREFGRREWDRTTDPHHVKFGQQDQHPAATAEKSAEIRVPENIRNTHETHELSKPGATL